MKTVEAACCLMVVLLAGPSSVSGNPGTSDAENNGTTASLSAEEDSSYPTEPPIELAMYSNARFLFGTSTNTRFVTTTVSTTVTCVSAINAGTACAGRKRRRSIKAINSSERISSLDSSLMQEDFDPRDRELPSHDARLLFSAATSFTTLTSTTNVNGAITISVSYSCFPATGTPTLCG